MTHNNLAVIYMRLSQDDKYDESVSITNQRAIIQHYCQEKNITIVKEFIDDGYTGGNFDRPGFKSMIDFLKQGNTHQVITKDLSRLGRDMTESSYYAERYFPENRIVYHTADGNYNSLEENPYAPFQFAMNDVYIRDSSRKIKAVLSYKRKNGMYCACPPFGYKKSPTNRNLLIPDEITAPIVKQIFDYAVSGMSTGAIADLLTKNGVITPLKYRILYRDVFSERGMAKATDDWNYTTVKRIIKNPVYTGATVLGKTKKVNPKSKLKVAVPKDEWAITENTHEALVSTETYQMANDKLSKRSTIYNSHVVKNGGHRVSIFRGVVFCKNCGAAMCSCGSVYQDDRHSYWYLACLNMASRSIHHCDHGARVKYSDLVELVTRELNELISLSDEQIKSIIDDIKKDNHTEKHNRELQQRCNAIAKEISDSNKIIEMLYRDSLNGKISENRFETLLASTETKTAQLEATLKDLETQFIDEDSKVHDYEQFFEIVKSHTKFTTLTPEIINAFIDRIEIGERSAKGMRKTPVTQNITIYYKFIGNAIA